MPVALAVVAVVAGHAGLDEARVADVDERDVDVVARVAHGRDRGDGRRGRLDVAPGREPATHGLADQILQLRLVHDALPASAPASIVTRSTMPTIAASTGAAVRRSAAPAARPSITTSTSSPTPAPTESTASSGAPRSVPSGACTCTSSSFAPSS